MNLSLPLAFTVGLLSALHCIGMCGGIASALSLQLPATVRRQRRAFTTFLLAYNGGRIASYALAGALAGGLGGGLSFYVDPAVGHRWLQWLAGLLLVAIGLHLSGWFPRLLVLERVGTPLWRRLEPIALRLAGVRSLPAAVLYGMVWGWLPCGVVYGMLISGIARAGAWEGALYMTAFGLGTLTPVMATGFLAGRIMALRGNPAVRRVGGLIIVAFGLITLWWPALTPAS